MKRLTILLCIFLSVASLYARPIQDDYRRAEEKARVSYAFGMIFGSDLTSVDIDIDYDAFTDGLRSVLDKNMQPQFTEQEAMEIVETAWFQAMERAAEQHRLIEEEFLYANLQRHGIQYTPSGLQYEILEYTEGEKPKANSMVRVNYLGTFIDGSLFDNSYEEGGAYIPLEMVIKGWTEGLMLMSEGSKYILYIPSNLAYGKDGIQGFIPPYSTLIFTVELLEILDEDFDPFNF
ncbi:MAG: FKBP-type peptidyl-prolyl cis-trans isomerase [Treponema sp.]|nr:FKBP-type peptidyl-prolyl cis-trans isomerase [Treponema sp.]